MFSLLILFFNGGLFVRIDQFFVLICIIMVSIYYKDEREEIAEYVF